MYRHLPKIDYQGKIIKDISIMMDAVAEVKTNAVAYSNYIVSDGETIESLSYDFYGDVKYNWVIMLMNDIIDPFYDWPLNQDEMRNFIDQKYGVGNDSQTHHWQLNGRVVPASTLNAVSITNLAYEELLNEEKRKVKILNEVWISVVERNIADSIV